MTKVVLTNVSNLQNELSVVNIINANNDRIEAAIENTLSRDGTSPNEMNSDLDMNNNRIYNLPEAVAATEPLRKQEFDELVADIRAEVGPAYLTSFTPAGTIAATDVQAAIEELDTELPERIDDRVAALLVAGTDIALTYNDAANTLTIDAISGSPVIATVANPSEYGAVGDGVANDTTAIQNLFNSGKLIYLTPGTYLCGALTIPAGARIMGPPTAILKHSTSSGTFISLGASNITLDGFTVDGNYTDTTVASGYLASHYGIKAYSGSSTVYTNYTFRNLIVKNFGDTGIDLRIVTNVLIENCEVFRCGYCGIACWSAVDTLVKGNTIHDIFPGSAGGGASAPFQNAYGATFSNYTGDRVSSFSTFERNYVYNVPTWEGLDEHNGEEISFINNIVANCSQGIACQHAVSGQPAKRIRIEGNIIYGYGASLSYNSQTCYPTAGVVVVGGLSADQAEQVIINNNSIYNTGDNRPSPGDGGAIAISNCRNFQINNNSIYVAYRFGIRLSDNTSDSLLYGQVHNNVIDGVISVSGVQSHIACTSRVLADVQLNFTQGTGGISQVGSPTYTTTFANNRSV